MDFFQLKFHETTVKNEVFAGIAMFMAMSYVLVVNPILLSQTGMPHTGAFVGTVLAAGITTIISAFYTKLPIALAPGIGLSSFFLLFGTGADALDYKVLLLATYASGMLICIFVQSGFYDVVLDVMGMEFRRIVMCGIGLALFFYGINTTGLIQRKGPMYTLGQVQLAPLLITALSLGTIVLLKKKNVRGHVFFGLLEAYLLGIGIDFYQRGYASGISFVDYVKSFICIPDDLDSIKQVMFAFPDMVGLFSDPEQIMNLMYIVFVFTMGHFFFAIGSSTSVFEEINLYIDHRIKDEGGLKKAITLDGIGSIASGMVGTSTVTTMGESLVGVMSGGKTGVTALTTGICFLSCVLSAPLFKSMATFVAAPALIYVGINLAIRYKWINKKSIVKSIFAVGIALYVGLTFNVGFAVLYGLPIFIVLEWILDKKKPAKYWWTTLLFVALQQILSIWA